MNRSLTLLRRHLVPALLAVLALPAFADSPYPNKLIRVVVPFAAGGAVDTVGRTLAEKLGMQMNESVIVDNKPGANANIGTEFVSRAAPDGYTLLVAANGVVTNNTLYPNLSFNGLKDFTPISRLGYAPLVLVTATSEPYKSVQDLIAAGKAKPGDLTFASAGNGSSGHLAGALLSSVGKFDAVHVAYKGGSPALIDLIAGRVSFMLLNPLEVLPHIQSGKLKALAITGDKRASMLPNVPTMAEAGLPNFDATVWWTLLAPANTPADVVARLNAETRKALADPAVVARLNGLGAVITPSSPQETSAFMKSESVKWEHVIRSANIKAD